MKNYIENQNEETKKYFNILSNDFPEFLNEYIYTTEMQRLEGVNQICGAYWKKTNIYDNMYSVLKHSVGVALIIWNFTHDKKQTISGLLHDITSSAFKHCIEFLNGDAEKQELMEQETLGVIRNSEDIITMYFFANIIKEINDKKYITKEDLYILSEKEIIDKIKNCEDNEISNKFNKFMKCNKIVECEEYNSEKFCVSRKVKRRYLNPITTNGRLYNISNKVKKDIDEYINMKISKYAYIDM